MDVCVCVCSLVSVHLLLKVVFNYGLTTGGASNAFVNEYAVLATLARHPNINAYLGQRVESIPGPAFGRCVTYFVPP